MRRNLSSRGPRMERGCRAAALALVAVLCIASRAGAEPISFIKIEFPPLGYFQGTAHFSGAEAPHIHYFRSGCPFPPVPPRCFTGYGPATCGVWQTPFEIGEAEPRTAQVLGESEHIVAPHAGEPECGPVFT